jgi:hypothetical protein
MEKTEIIEKIEYIANKGKDDQTKLNALSYLLYRLEYREKEEALKIENEKFKEQTKERIENLMKAFN